MIGDWIITFELARGVRRIQTPLDRQWDFDELRHGFWLDANHNLTTENRGVYWVPPSQIKLIQRLQ